MTVPIHDIHALTAYLFDNPELGYKEEKTAQAVLEFIAAHAPEAEIERFAITGIRTQLSDRPGKKKLALIAELDSVFAPTHFNSDATTGAAQNCGHFTQVTIMLQLFKHYVTTVSYKDLDFDLVFIFVPAEEYLDLQYRKDLRAQGKIKYLGGKPQAMSEGVFDDIDFGICVHAIGEKFDQTTIEIDCDLAGFLYKNYSFEGKASHAGWDPFSGRNAYSMSTLFNTAIGLGRQHMREDKQVRINPIVLESNMGTNVIPNAITVGTDLRCIDTDYMVELAGRLDNMAAGAALALDGQVTIDTEMGYLPFIQNRYLNSFVKETFDQTPEIAHIITDRGAIAAAGDVGDLSYMFPTIQVSYGGFEGTIHGDDFRMIDGDFVLETFPAFLTDVLTNMSENLDYSQFYKRSYQDYEHLIASLLGEKEAHEETISSTR